MKFKLSTRKRYLIFGILFGCLFPIFSVLFDCYFIRETSFSFSTVQELFFTNPLHFIIATAPIFLGLAFYIAGRFAHNHKTAIDALKEKNETLSLLNDSYNTFNYHVSHDLKSIITNGQSLAIMIQKYAQKNDSDKVAELSKILQEACQSGSETIQGFLHLHKLTNRVSDEVASVHVLPVIDGIKKQFQETTDFDLIVAQKDFEELPLHETEAKSVFQNLISNSINYGQGKTVITISLIQSGKNKTVIYKDNGQGIDMAKYGDKLFKPFARVEEQKLTNSTGLGLYIVKRILANNGATVDLKSEHGKGVTFTLVFENLK
ncbi:MAG: sensor histidine kinase [Bacteroidia bacterium]